MVIRSRGLKLHRELFQYPPTTDEEERRYGAAIQEVVRAHPGIVAATNVICSQEYVAGKFRQQSFVVGKSFEEAQQAAREYLREFNNPWGEQGRVESWLLQRDLGLWNDFNQLQRYDASRRAFVTSHLPFCLDKAAQFTPGKGSLEDSFQLAASSLEKAAIRFDASRGYRFRTYAVHWIKQAISASLPGEVYALALPSGIFKRLGVVQKVQGRYFQELERMPFADELGRELGIQEGSLDDLKRALQVQRGVKETIGHPDSGGREVEDSVRSPLDQVMFSEVLEVINQRMSRLTARERDILSLRYGLREPHAEMTLREVGEIYGVCAERVRQIEERALDKLCWKYPRKAVRSMTTRK